MRVFWLIALLALGLTPRIAAAAPGIEGLQVGWDGTIVPGTWSPIRVRLRGGGADTAGQVEVILQNRFQTGAQATPIAYPAGAYGQDIALPAGVERDVVLWLPVDANMAGIVRLTAEGQTIAEQPVDFRTNRASPWPLVGVLAEAPSVARAVSQIELPYEELFVPLSVVRLAAAEIPASAEHLRALSALLVQGNVPGTLTGQQRRAVAEWMAAGGHLVLLGGPDAARAAAVLPAGALPIAFDAAEGAADLGPLAAWAKVEPAPAAGPAARFRPTRGLVLAGTAERPLAWRQEVGQGTVTLLAADAGLEPLASWSGTPALLAAALEPGLPGSGESGSRRAPRYAGPPPWVRLQSAVEALPAEAFPPWRIVALLLVGFAVAAGPVLHLALGQFGRREWVWLAAPGAAILTAGALYEVGVGRQGRDVIVNVVGHVRLDPDGGSRELAIGYYAPTRPTLTVAVPGDASLRAISRAGQLAHGPSGPLPPTTIDPPFRIIAGRETRIEWSGGESAMRTAILLGRIDAGVGTIRAHLRIEDGTIVGMVRNDTPDPIEDAAIVVGLRVARIGSLAPGQTSPVRLDPSAVAPGLDGLPLSYRVLGRPPNERSGGSVAPGPPPRMAMPPGPPPPAVKGMAGGSRGSAALSPTPTRAPAAALAIPIPTGQPTPPIGAPMSVGARLEIPRDAEVLRRVRLLDAVVTSGAMMPTIGSTTMPLTFLGFTQAPFGVAIPAAEEHPAYYLTLVEQPLQLDLPPGPFALPSALVPADLMAVATTITGGSGSGSGSGQIVWIEIGGGSMTYAFRPPLPPRTRVDAIVVSTRQVGPSVPVAQRGPPAGIAQPGPAEPDVFSIFSWRSGAWETLPSGTEQARVAPATEYVGPDGLVKIQVSAPADRLVRIVVPELAFEGTVLE